MSEKYSFPSLTVLVREAAANEHLPAYLEKHPAALDGYVDREQIRMKLAAFVATFSVYDESSRSFRQLSDGCITHFLDLVKQAYNGLVVEDAFSWTLEEVFEVHAQGLQESCEEVKTAVGEYLDNMARFRAPNEELAAEFAAYVDSTRALLTPDTMYVAALSHGDIPK